jgi:hypothetical protein
LWCHQELVNPTAVYSTAEQTRLAQAKLSDKQFLFVQPKKLQQKQNTATTATKLGIIN